MNKDAVGLDLNVPVLEEDAREVQRLPAVEVYLHNPIDWDELQEDLFDLSNPIYFQRFAPYQLIEILLFCQSTWRDVGLATKGIDRLVCRVRFRDPFTYRVFRSVYCCLSSCVLFLGPPSSVRYSISSPFIPNFPFSQIP